MKRFEKTGLGAVSVELRTGLTVYNEHEEDIVNIPFDRDQFVYLANLIVETVKEHDRNL
jgi:hypothetical protein